MSYSINIQVDFEVDMFLINIFFIHHIRVKQFGIILILVLFVGSIFFGFYIFI